MLNGILASGWDFPPQPHSDPSSVVGLTRFCVCLHTRCSFAFLPCPVPPQTPLQIAPPNLHLAEVLSFPTSPSLPSAPCLSRSSDSSACRCLVVSSFCSHTVCPHSAHAPGVRPRRIGWGRICHAVLQVPMCDRSAEGQCQAEMWDKDFGLGRQRFGLGIKRFPHRPGDHTHWLSRAGLAQGCCPGLII